MSQNFEILDRTVAYDGFFKLERYRLKHGLFAGGMTPELTRELLRRGRVAAVLPYDPALDAVVLVEQFRIGAIDAPNGAWLMEVVAGVAEPQEAVADVAHREAAEEAGLELQELMRICDYYPSPGMSSELVSLYCARVDASSAGGLHGLQEENEDIRAHVLPFDEAMDMLENGIINNAMPIIALQWLALNRERLLDLWDN
ncbi:NUDIX domain-containing protein [Aquisalimonas asiatica]|uniref:ADP-ribose pyrophosphatase n=1 Tax=Aquisalimonas asiatica TaxID=406100 RepID=A0A1H8QCV7_9GAMM|nr:NUDIX domain-containing protein [Aquisalimonas asiatica]SEO52052.1 ADP-ribose pyrophosphatase [Aquisalimonas asiatica]